MTSPNETRQQISTSETIRRAVRLAHRLAADDYRAILGAMPAKKDLRAVRRAVAVVETSRPGTKGAKGSPRGVVLPPPEYETLADTLKDPSIKFMANGKGALSTLAVIVLSALFGILTVIFLGMAVAQVMHPAAVAISAALTVITFRVVRARLGAADILLDAGTSRAWSVLYAAVLHRAISTGEIEAPRDWGRGKAQGLHAVWDAAGLDWGVVDAAS